MTAASVEQRLRRFLLGVTAAIFIGGVVELILVDHTEETLQWLPFIFSVVGFFSVLGAWMKPGRRSLLILRWVMGGVAIGSLVGVYLHFTGNFEFTREINPSYTFWQSIWPAMKGANPLLAPGIYFLAGILGYSATWKHPTLRDG